MRTFNVGVCEINCYFSNEKHNEVCKLFRSKPSCATKTKKRYFNKNIFLGLVKQITKYKSNHSIVKKDIGSKETTKNAAILIDAVISHFVSSVTPKMQRAGGGDLIPYETNNKKTRQTSRIR
jgi:hypothetical protein